MNRPALLFIGVFVLVFAAGVFLVQQGNGGAAPQQPLPEAQPADAAKADVAPRLVMRELDDDEEPAEPRLPLLLKRWPLPRDLLPERWDLDVKIAIDPTRPAVLIEKPGGAVSWDSVTGATRPVAKVEPPTVLRRSVSGSRLLVEVHDRKTDRKLLELKESPTRAACPTPDGKRLIVVGNPSMYPAYTVIKIPSGESTTRPEEPFKNVRLFDVAGGAKLGELGLKINKLDDNVWTAAVAPDGKTFFLVTTRELFQLGFESAFGRRPLPPNGR